MTPKQLDFSLHLIFSIEAWPKANEMISATDRVLFLQDACYLLQQPIDTVCELVYGRSLDCTARNIHPYVGIEIIDDEQWLELSEHAKNIISW